MSLQQLQNVTNSHVARSLSSPPLSGAVKAKVISVHDGDICDLVFIMQKRAFSKVNCLQKPYVI